MSIGTVLGAGVVACAGTLAGCTAVASSTCDETRTCVRREVESNLPGDASALDASTKEPTCEVSRPPSEQPCLVSDAYGVFVSPAGSDTSGGTKGAPVATVGQAIARAKVQGKAHVFVCAGTYAESVLLDAAVSLHGGYRCPSSVEAGAEPAAVAWEPGGGPTRVQAPADAGPALRVERVSQPLVVEDVELLAPNATGTEPGGAGKSSLAVLVNQSREVTVRRVTVRAGDGAPAAPNGPRVENVLSPAQTDPGGNPAAGLVGGQAKMCTCSLYGASIGGHGGYAGQKIGEHGGNGSSVPAVTPSPSGYGAGGVGAVASPGSSCSGGIPGANGAARAGGTKAAQHGAVVEGTWMPSSGSDGETGNPAQGGGGGGGGITDNQPFGGGGGGCGGCGGAGGAGGKGGGASIALVSVKSVVRLESTKLVSATGGAGGHGTEGSGGSSGGGGGATGACGGGGGGYGGGGGGGAGGTGGLSAGIVYVDSAPVIDGTAVVEADVHGAVTLGRPGDGGGFGAGGVRGDPYGNSGKPGEVGLAGVARAVFNVP